MSKKVYARLRDLFPRPESARKWDHATYLSLLVKQNVETNEGCGGALLTKMSFKTTRGESVESASGAFPKLLHY